MSATIPLRSSVLLTTYNGERFIEAQLTSILNQTQPVDQVLIFDDGSTDQTVYKVNTFIQANGLTNWSISVNPTNLGPAANTLTHVGGLTGDIVFLGDQDDVWEPHKVATMAQYMANHTDLAMLVSRTVIIDEYGKTSMDATIQKGLINHSRIHRGSGSSIQDLTFVDFIGYSSVPLHAMCIRGNIIRKICSANDFPALSQSLGADWYIGIWSTVLGQCWILPDVLMRRRVHGGNISLGRLRKTTTLSATQERRITVLRESLDAHLSLLLNEPLRYELSRENQQDIKQMTEFLKLRLAFAEHASPWRAMQLLFNFRKYSRSAGTPRGALRMWVADIMYAYNINWKLKKRA